MAQQDDQHGLAGLQEEVTAARRDIAATPDDHPSLADKRNHLRRLLEARYKSTRELCDLTETIDLVQKAIAATPDGHLGKSGLLYILGMKFWRRHAETGEIDDLEEAIGSVRQAIATTPNDHRTRIARLDKLSAMLTLRFGRTREMADLEGATEVIRQAVAAAPDNHPDMPGWLWSIGTYHAHRYEQLSSADDLDEAIRFTQQAVAGTTDTAREYAGRLNALRSLLENRYMQTGVAADLEETVAVAQKAVTATPADHPDRAIRLFKLGIIFLRRYAQLQGISDVDEAISVTRQAVSITGETHHTYAAMVYTLGNLLHIRSKVTGTREDLEGAIKATRLAVAATPDDHPDHVSRLSRLVSVLVDHYQTIRTANSLGEAVAVIRQTLAVTPDGNPERVSLLNTLIVLLQDRYEQEGAISDLDEAIKTIEEAIASFREGQFDRARWLYDLGINLGLRYEHTQALNHLDEAVGVSRQAVAITPYDNPYRAMRLNHLGIKLTQRYKRRGNLCDLEEAISMGRQVVAATPDGDPDEAGWLHNLGIILRYRYQRVGTLSDLEEAILIARHAITATPDDDPKKLGLLTSLANHLGCRHKHTKLKSDLEEAIALARQVVAETPNNHSDWPDRLINLASNLSKWHECTGSTSELEEAITIAQQAVGITPDGDPRKPGWLNNLGHYLEHRYVQTEFLGDLSEAIRLTRKAVAATPVDHPDLAVYLVDLGIKLVRKYERAEVAEDLQEAIEVTRTGLTATPYDHPQRSVRLINLGKMISHRYTRTRVTADLEEATELIEQGIAATPDNHNGKPYGWAARAGNLLYQRDKASFEEAIGLLRRAVTISSDGIEDRPVLLAQLGSLLEGRYELSGVAEEVKRAMESGREWLESPCSGDPDELEARASLEKAMEVSRKILVFELGDQSNAVHNDNYGNESQGQHNRAENDLHEAVEYYHQVWNTPTAIPFHRVRAAAHCLKLLIRQGKLDVAAHLGREVIGLMPAVNTRLLDRNDQQYVVSIFAGISADLCALHLASDQVEDAIKYLEEGRAVILSQQIDSRSDVSEVARTHPEIARRYEKLRDGMNSAIRDPIEDVTVARAREQRCRDMLDLDACIEHIRGIPGHERFLLSQTTAAMQRCAAGGYIVIVNIAEFRSDAILISPIAIKAINLPQMSVDAAKSWLSREWTGRRAERAEKNRAYSDYLAWLWQSCVEQILQELRTIHDLAPNELLRVWWLGSGLAGSMPFHAAGLHRTRETETAYHTTISSYTPSIKALAHAQSLTKEVEDGEGCFLVVTMPTTPSKNQKPMPSLPGVIEEKNRLVGLSRGHITEVDMKQPSVDQVLESLRQCCIAHFACHGLTDASDPSDSGLILQKKQGADQVCHENEENNDSNGSSVQDRLTVKKISELNLKHAKLAYLSACSTAQNKAEKLSDESIHVVSGFQVAGFPHVVGCLWRSNDRVCVEVSSKFYSILFDQFQSPWINGMVASALREAVMEARADDLAMPLNWAQFVHYGP